MRQPQPFETKVSFRCDSADKRRWQREARKAGYRDFSDYLRDKLNGRVRQVVAEGASSEAD